jgi:hypothetical protein
MAITAHMLAESKIDKDQARRVIDRYRISNVKTRVEAIAQTMPIHFMFGEDAAYLDYDAYIHKSHVTMLTMDVPEPEFARMVGALDELHDMMQHPEVAKLILEAKFIHRLRKGHM